MKTYGIVEKALCIFNFDAIWTRVFPNFVGIKTIKGAIAQAARRWLLTAETWVQSHVT
jgi:hypothetical protein